jgi:Flp pilus assembly protein CpaB
MGRPTLKRSNRLILLIGFFLAAAAFVGVVMLLGSGGGGGTPPEATTTTYIVAARDIPIATTVTADMIETKDVKITEMPDGAYTLPADAINQTTTDTVLKGQKIGPQTFSTETVNPNIARLLGTGHRAMSIQVALVDGVGMLIKPGDRVDVVVAISGLEKFPIVTTDPATGMVTPVQGLNATSVKAIIQNVEVVGILLRVARHPRLLTRAPPRPSSSPSPPRRPRCSASPRSTPRSRSSSALPRTRRRPTRRRPASPFAGSSTGGR